MNLMISSVLVVLLYAVLTKATNTMDERVSKFETFVREQSIQLDEQNWRIESMEAVIDKQQNQIRELNNQLWSVMMSNHERSKDITLFKRILRSHLNHPKQKSGQLDTKPVFTDRSDISKDRQRRHMVRKSDIPVEKGQLNRTISNKTAFYAYMNKNENAPSPHHTLIFDYIVTNTINAYTNFTGIFTGPSVGVYVFTFSIRMGCRSFGAFEFVHNAQVAGAFYNEHNGDCETDTFTGTVVLNVKQGDVVFLRTHTGRSFSGNIESDVYGRSAFCGWSI